MSCVGASEAAEAVRALCPILCKECLVDDASTEDNNGTSTAGAGKKSTAAAVAVVLVLLLIATVVGIVLFRKRRKEERYRMLLGKRFNGQAAGMVNTSYEQRAVPRNQGGVAMANPAFDSSIMEGADTYEEPNAGQVEVRCVHCKGYECGAPHDCIQRMSTNLEITRKQVVKILIHLLNSFSRSPPFSVPSLH